MGEFIQQILMTEDWIGKTRVDCAKAAILRIAALPRGCRQIFTMNG